MATTTMRWSYPRPQTPEHHYRYDPDKAQAYVATTLAWLGDVASEHHARHDADHTPDLLNEPHLGGGSNNDATEDQWSCWLHGCQVSGIEVDGTTVPGTWKAAGMQSLIDAIRGTGANQPILLDGLQWASAFNGLPTHLPRDWLNQMAAVYHLSGQWL